MSDAKPRKTGRKTAHASKAADAESAAPPPEESRSREEPLLAIEQVSGADAWGPDGLDAEIRRRAYEIYLSRGGMHGDDLSDWLEAERLVRARGGPGSELTDVGRSGREARRP